MANPNPVRGNSVVILGLSENVNLGIVKDLFENVGEIVSIKLADGGIGVICKFSAVSGVKDAVRKIKGDELSGETFTTICGDQSAADQYFASCTPTQSNTHSPSNPVDTAINVLKAQGYTISSPNNRIGMPPSTYVPPPKLSLFSGVPAQKAGEVSFEAWVYEVKSLQKSGYSKSILAPIVRRSLRGDAALLTTVHLGLDVSIEGIISKLEGRYGTAR